MLFGVESDTQQTIDLYVVLDSGGAIPSLIIKNDGVELLRLESNASRDNLAKAGRHATGQCGFRIDASVLPDIESYAHLELVEPESGITIYRRWRPDFAAMRVFRLETHLLPLWRFDDALKLRFQHWYKGIDRWGRETAQETFMLIHSQSTYASGRLFMRHIERYAARGTKMVAIVRDPYDELAERLIVLKNVGEQTNDLLGPRDALIYEGVIAELAGVEQLDGPGCKRFLKRLPGDIGSVLSNPFVRQLTSAFPGDQATAAAIGMSLQMLAQFTILGLRSEAEEFSKAVAELVETPEMPVMKEFAKVTELGNALREIREAEQLLEFDLELFHQTKQIFASLPKH